jgi:hypothetical protein
MSQVHILVSTIVERRIMVEGLICMISDQSFIPDEIHLVLDRYDTSISPTFSDVLPVVLHRWPTTGGPGGRWRIAEELPEDAILINLDDDQCLDAPNVLEVLIQAVENYIGVISYRGTYLSGHAGVAPLGHPLICISAGVMACYVKNLQGLEATLKEIREKCNFDPFGDMGDDDAVLSTHFWKKNIPMYATGELAVHEAPGAQENSQFEKRRRDNRPLFWQRQEIAKVTGWPWRLI